MSLTCAQALHRDLFCEGNPIPVKWALERMGKLPSGLLRLPLVELSELYHTRVETALAQVKHDIVRGLLPCCSGIYSFACLLLLLLFSLVCLWF